MGRESDKQVRDLEKLSEQIAELRIQLTFLEKEREDLRKRLRAALSGSGSAGAEMQRIADSLGFPASAFEMQVTQVEGESGTSRIVFSAVPRNSGEEAGTAALREAAEVVKRLGQATADVLATELGLSQEAARLRLNRAYKAKLLVRVGHGVYRAAETEEPAEFCAGSPSDASATEEGAG